jgi:hypothetical protein
MICFLDPCLWSFLKALVRAVRKNVPNKKKTAERKLMTRIKYPPSFSSGVVISHNHF